MAPLVFIVEDESAHFVLMHRAILRELPNASIQCFQQAQACVSELENKTPDIIIVDYVMPGMNGLEFLETLNRIGKDIPVVMVTGQGNEDVAVRAMKAGAWDYLVKSEGFFELLPCVISKVFKDITERKKNEDQLRRYLAQLELRKREFEDFAFAASHDLQEPLRKILVFGDILTRECQDLLLPEHRDFLQRMIRSADRMRVLVHSLFSYCKVGVAPLYFTPVALGEAVKETLQDLEGRVNETGATVEVGDLPVIEGDLEQLRVLLHNLVANALKCVQKGGKPVIRIYGRTIESPKGPEVVLAVQDNGIGFDERGLGRPFRPFIRQHGRDEYDGPGIGLAICRRIVARHGGTITATSAPGKGATFVVTLPFRQSTDASSQ